MNSFSDVEQAIAAIKAGEFVALLDHPEREGEADLLVAAQFATGEKLNVMITDARGMVTIAIAAGRLEELGIPLLEPANCGCNWPRFAAPVDYKVGTTTGVSAFDRAATAVALTDLAARPEDFARPGHLLPLAASPGGIAERAGHTEGAVALVELAGLYPAVVMCEMLAPDGHMARGERLREIIRQHGFASVSVERLAEYQKRLKA